MQSNFASAFSLVKQQFIKVVETIDSIYLFGDFSILDFFIALLVMGAILPILIVTIANWSSDSFSASLRAEDRSRNQEQRREFYLRREQSYDRYLSRRLEIYQKRFGNKK